NNFENLIRCDLENETNELVSLRANGTGPPDNISLGPAINSDGSLIAYHSTATDIIPGAYRGFTNVFVRNITSHTNILVSVNLAGTTGGNGHSANAVFSPDDRWIVFSSAASDLTTNATSGLTNLFARDLYSNTTRIISVGA